MTSLLKHGPLPLTEWETYLKLQPYSVPVAPCGLARTLDEAREIARSLGGWVVVKVVSPDILHKTEADCVRVGLKDPDAAALAFADVVANARAYRPDARIDGVLVQQMAPPGVEIIVGGLNDPSFGPVLMVGLGGIFTETMKDTAFRLAPIDPAEAISMLRGLKAFPLLTGARGRPPVNLEALARALSGISRLVAAWPELKELDLNPMIAWEGGVLAVDGMATLQETQPAPGPCG